LRQEAYPFDWNVTPLKAVYELLKNNYDGLMDELLIGTRIKRLYFDENQAANASDPKVVASNSEIYPVICKKYNILFPHYFDDVEKATILKVKDKMRRRIENLSDLLKSDMKVCLIYVYGINDWHRQCYEEHNINPDIFDPSKSVGYVAKIKELVGDHVEVSSLDQSLRRQIQP
tara:strand:+ start:1466 stop:1987 length:522 start_codon:yes stop_codon:yes gene_type:complete